MMYLGKHLFNFCVEVSSASVIVFGIVVVEVKEGVRIIFVLSEPPIDDFFLNLFQLSSGDVVYLLEFSFGVGIEHIGHPLSLH